MSAVDTTTHHHHDHAADSMDVFGFWLYLLTDCVLFASLFATYMVLHRPGAFGPDLRPLLNFNIVLAETFLLLTSNLTFGLAVLAGYRQRMGAVLGFLALTFILGAGFLGLELYEFHHLIGEGYHWSVSGAASAFFVLVGTHGLHVAFGLLWMLCFMLQLPVLGLQRTMKRRLVYLGLFWNFLDLVWIFVFTIVYLMSAL